MVLLDARSTLPPTERCASQSLSQEVRVAIRAILTCGIEQLLIIAWLNGGRWTNYRSKDQRWTGTLLKVLEILKDICRNRAFFHRERSGVQLTISKIKLAYTHSSAIKVYPATIKRI